MSRLSTFRSPSIHYCQNDYHEGVAYPLTQSIGVPTASYQKHVEVRRQSQVLPQGIRHRAAANRMRPVPIFPTRSCTRTTPWTVTSALFLTGPSQSIGPALCCQTRINLVKDMATRRRVVSLPYRERVTMHQGRPRGNSLPQLSYMVRTSQHVRKEAVEPRIIY